MTHAFKKPIVQHKVQSPTGKIHLAFLTHKDKGVAFYDPYCNHRNWLGDYWGKKWVAVDGDKEVTCKNCLSANGELSHEVKVTKHYDETTRDVKRKFRSKAEADAYLQGVKDGRSWRFFRRISIEGKPL